MQFSFICNVILIKHSLSIYLSIWIINEFENYFSQMLNEQIKKLNPQDQLIINTVTYLITCFFIYDQFFFQNDSMMRVIRNLTVHDAIAGIS